VARDAQGGFVVDMGVPGFAPGEVPLAGFDAERAEYALAVGGQLVHFGAVSLGNPHAIIEVTDVANAAVTTLGPALQRDPAFPRSVNVGFAEVVARDRVRLRVFERGAGETLACGSGACAAVACLVRRGRVDANREIAVELPGGALRIRYDQTDGRIRMGGPTAFVFEGQMLSGSSV
jgi:diaminopimelate epimerase